MMPTVYSTKNQEWLPSIFNDFFNDAWVTPKFRGNTPAINVTEDNAEYKVEVAAPGMTRDDFKIALTHDGEIVISLEKKTENKDENKERKYLRREFSYSKFEQRFALPDNVSKEGISALMNDGVLSITIPKKTPEQKAQETQYIEIK